MTAGVGHTVPSISYTQPLFNLSPYARQRGCRKAMLKELRCNDVLHATRSLTALNPITLLRRRGLPISARKPLSFHEYFSIKFTYAAARR